VSRVNEIEDVELRTSRNSDAPALHIGGESSPSENSGGGAVENRNGAGRVCGRHLEDGSYTKAGPREGRQHLLKTIVDVAIEQIRMHAVSVWKLREVHFEFAVLFTHLLPLLKLGFFGRTSGKRFLNLSCLALGNSGNVRIPRGILGSARDLFAKLRECRDACEIGRA